MNAVRLFRPGDLRVVQVEKPSPKAGQVLVKVMAVGVCGSDIPRVNTYGAHVSPLTIGHEFSGIIEEAHDSVTRFQVGDKITVAPLIPCYQCEWCKQGEYSLCEKYDYYGSRSDGAMAEYVAVNEANLLKLPDSVSYAAAAMVDPCANAMHALLRAKFKAGNTVCVSGVGPIGQLAVQLAREFEAKQIIAVDICEEKLEAAKKGGAHYVINARNEDSASEILKYTSGRGVDLVIETSGAPSAQKSAIRSCAKLGKVVFVGISHKDLALSEKEVDSILRGQLELLGSWNSFSHPFPGWEWTESLRLMSLGRLHTEDIISHKLLLDEAPAMFKKLAEEDLYFNKVMFFPNGIE